MRATDVAPGYRFVHHDVSCEALAAAEPWSDWTGLPLVRFMARRLDTGQEGYVVYGTNAEVRPDGA